MKSWYKIAQEEMQQTMGFLEDVPIQEPQVAQEVIDAPKTIDMLDELIEYVEGRAMLSAVLNRNGFDWSTVDLHQKQVITIDIMGKIYVIDDYGYPETKDAEEWIDNMYEYELYTYVPPKEDENFWKSADRPSEVYHATPNENVDNILKNGLEPRDQTRGITNRGTGSAVFTSENPHDIDSYGDVILVIDLNQMMKDGFMPSASKEEPVEEAQTRSQLAYQLGISNYQPSTDYSSDGISESTVVIFDKIPPKYISVT